MIAITRLIIFAHTYIHTHTHTPSLTKITYLIIRMTSRARTRLILMENNEVN